MTTANSVGLPVWLRLGFVAAIAAGVLAAAVITPGTAQLRLFGVALPGICTFRAATGINCPGCGLTRSIVATVHGDLDAAFESHRVGPPLLMWLLLEGLRHGSWLLFTSRRGAIERVGWWIDRAGLVFLPTLAIAWFAELG